MQFKCVCLQNFDARTLGLWTQLTSDGKERIEHTGQEDFLVCCHFGSQEFQCERIILCILYNLLYIAAIVHRCTRHRCTIQTNQMVSDCNGKMKTLENGMRSDDIDQNSTIQSILLTKNYGHLLCVILQFQIDGIIEHFLCFDFWNVVVVVEYQSTRFAHNVNTINHHFPRSSYEFSFSFLILINTADKMLYVCVKITQMQRIGCDVTDTRLIR